MEHRHSSFTWSLVWGSMLMLSIGFLEAQPNGAFQALRNAVPTPDAAYTNSKQARRIQDQGARRFAAGHANMDWARWQAWERWKAENPSGARGTGQPEAWVNLGPDTLSGRIIALAFHPTDSNELLVGAASGGLWRTRDYGNTWSCLTDAYPTMGVGAVAYNPQNPSSILIASGEGYGFGGEFTSGFGILISHNGGNTWKTTALDVGLADFFAGMDLVWHPTDTNVVNAATSFGVYRSSDGGNNWSPTLARLPARMKAAPDNPDRIYCTARYYTADFPGGFFVSEDAGQTWAQSGAGLPSEDAFGYTSLHIHATYPNQIYMVVGRSSVFGSGPMEGLYKSRDFGASFTEIPTGVDLMCYHPPFSSICQSWFGNTIAVAPQDTNALFCGGTRFRRSLDGGFSWVTADVNLGASYYSLHPDHHQTQFHPITGDLIDCHDGGVGISSNRALTWESKSNGLLTHQFYAIAVGEDHPQTVIGGTQDVGAFTVRNTGTGGWKNPVGGDAFGCAIAPQDANTWYITDYNFGRQRSTNAGESWAAINSGTSGINQWRSPIEAHPQVSDLLFSADDLALYRSDNAGSFWAPEAAQGPIQDFAFDAINADLIYASELWSNTIFRSEDGGTTWSSTASFPGFPVNALATHPTEEGALWAAIGSFAEGDQLYRSEDRGDTWTAVGQGLPAVPMHTIAVDPSNPGVLYIGGDLGVWHSTDGDSTWSSFNEGLPIVVVEDLHYRAADTSLHIGTYGRGYWRTKAIAPPLPSALSDAAAVHEALRAMPNPANHRIRIEGPWKEGLLQLVDAHGRVWYSHPWNGQAQVPVVDWPSGSYAAVLQGPNGQAHARFLVLHGAR